MISQSPKLDLLEDETPLLFHPNALAYVFNSPNRENLPTQIVYPDTSLAIGLSANPFDFIPKLSHNIDDETNDEDGNRNEGTSGLLLIHASQSPDEAVKIRHFPYYLRIIFCNIFQLILLLSLAAISVVLDLPIWWMINNKKVLLTQCWIVFAYVLSFYILFTLIHSVLEMILLSGVFLKIYWVDRMKNQIMPHVLALSGNPA